MIVLRNVSDVVQLDDVKYILAQDANLTIPPGRYALLLGEPILGRYAVDLLAGTRPPLKGRIYCSGLRSWPIGRGGVLQGALTGEHIVGLIARLYGLDRTLCESILERVLTNPAQLGNIMSDWPAPLRREFIFTLALLPKSSVYVVEGAFPAQTGRFAKLWAPLFGDRTMGQTLIMSNLRTPTEFMNYCDKALVFDRGRVFIESNLEHALTRYVSASQEAENSQKDQSAREDEEEF